TVSPIFFSRTLEVDPNTLTSSVAKTSGSRAMVFMSKKKLMAFHVSVPRILDIVSVTDWLTKSSQLMPFHPLSTLGRSVGTDSAPVAGGGWKVANSRDLKPTTSAKTTMGTV